MVQLDGKLMLSQYGQWDGYPSGQGITVLQFLLDNKDNLDKFKANLRTVVDVTEEQLKQFWKDAGADDSEFVGMDVADKFGEMHPQLSRECGAEILNHVLNNENLYVNVNTTFMYDSLFCEWAYMIDFDKNTLEVYQGFNKTPLVEGVDRFYTSEISRNEYHPVKLIKTFPLDDLPDVNAFVKECNKASHYPDDDGE
jgi:hypothetical protein